MRITVGYGDPARGQVRKLLRTKVLDRVPTHWQARREDRHVAPSTPAHAILRDWHQMIFNSPRLSLSQWQRPHNRN